MLGLYCGLPGLALRCGGCGAMHACPSGAWTGLFTQQLGDREVQFWELDEYWRSKGWAIFVRGEKKVYYCPPCGALRLSLRRVVSQL